MLPPLSPGHTYADELHVALQAANAASATIMAYYTSQSSETYTKGDGSPVTDADLDADSVIRETISAGFRDDAFMTEEVEDDASRLQSRRVWIVDPIDGTAQFVAGTGRFDVLIALAVDGEALVAVAMQPTTGLTHAAIAGAGAWRRESEGWERLILGTPEVPPRLAASKYYLLPQQEPALATVAASMDANTPPLMDVGFQPRALDPKERRYDAFLGFPQDPALFAAREWDIAASDLIVHEAGGVVTDFHGRRHRYNKQDTHIEDGLLVSASPALHARLLDAIAQARKTNSSV